MIEGLKETTQLASTYGLGVVLAVINGLALVGLIFWVLKTCHHEKSQLAKIINEALVTLNSTVNQKLAIINIQTELIRNVSDTMKEANRWNREEHERIMKAQNEILNRGE